MAWYVVPSLAAMAVKLILLWITRHRLQSHTNFIVLLVSLFVLNAAEFTSYFVPDSALPNSLWIMQLYYLAAVIATAAVFDVCLEITHDNVRRWRDINALIAFTVGLLTVVPGTVVAGIEPMGDLVRRVPGPAMGVWMSYVVPTLLASIGTLIVGIRKAPSPHRKRQSRALLIAFVPLLLSTVVIIVLMAMNVRANGAVTISVMTTILAIVLYLSDSRYQLFKLLSRIPTTPEYRERSQLLSLIQTLQEVATTPDRQDELRQILRRMEMAGIGMAIEANEGNLSKTARNIGVSRATLVRKRGSE